MEDELITILDNFGYQYFRQGSCPEYAALPETFFTFWQNGVSDDNFYNNQNHSMIYSYDLNIYSQKPNQAYMILQKLITILKAKNWICASDGYDIASDMPNYVGRGLEIKFIKGELYGTKNF